MIIMEVVATCFNSRATPWCRGRIQKVGYIEVDTWQLPRNSPYRIESDAARRKREKKEKKKAKEKEEKVKAKAAAAAAAAAAGAPLADGSAAKGDASKKTSKKQTAKKETLPVVEELPDPTLEEDLPPPSLDNTKPLKVKALVYTIRYEESGLVEENVRRRCIRSLDEFAIDVRRAKAEAAKREKARNKTRESMFMFIFFIISYYD